jgi:hypothetical protein
MHWWLIRLVYIITEDSKSGYVFWQQLASITIKDYKIYSAEGIYGFSKILESLFGVVTCDDTIILAIDNSAAAEVFRVINEGFHIADVKGCKVYRSAYYCFEEYFISFSDIAKWGCCTDAIVLDIRSIIANSILSNASYFSLEFKTAISNYQTSLYFDSKNRERFASQLLSYLTTNSGRCFRIAKKEFGFCWLANCAIDAIKCKKCCLRYSPMIAIDKAIYILNNSLELLDGCEITQINPLT